MSSDSETTVRKFNEKIQFVKQNKALKGVLFAGIDPDNDDNVVVGFSMANKMDIHNLEVVDGLKLGGFNKEIGLKLAKKRAIDYIGCSESQVFLYKDETGKREYYPCGKGIMDGVITYSDSEKRMTINIPTTLTKPFVYFIDNCIKYYKGKKFPKWLIGFQCSLMADEIRKRREEHERKMESKLLDEQEK